MAIRIFLATCGSACLLASGVAFAQQAGSTSGPGAGTNVEPSTAIQKENSGALGAKDKGASSTAAGAPGVEAHPGSEGGRAPQRKTGN
jgi:hypothetical protein